MPPKSKSNVDKNSQIVKSLLKLESNKTCAECGARHPRWASWTLGIFLCIRCSGIHRSMGVHISRVKSVDLDSWTDEQIQSMLSWGNARANKYWAAKLAPGHVPSEAKIENFIRTKYELKRWVMDGPMPDPSTLDVEDDDDIPLSIVKEKQTIDRRESVRKSSVARSGAAVTRQPEADLLGGDSFAAPAPAAAAAAAAAPPTSASVPPKAQATPPKAASTKDSLLGLDFLGTEPSLPPRPSSTTATQPRPDLKQSILSLYASNPRPQAQQQSSMPSGAMSSPTITSHQTQGPMGGLNDAFGSLSFSTSTFATQSAAPPKPDPFSGLTNIPSKSSATSGLSGGSFFDSKPTTAIPSHAKKPSAGSSDPFASFSSPAPSKPATKPTPAPASSGFGDLFDLSTPAPAPTPSAPATQHASSSVFNLSSTNLKSPTAASPTTSITTNKAISGFDNGFSNSDVWGGNAWNTPAEPAKAPAAPATAPKPASSDMGWSSGGSLANTSIVPGASGGFSTKPKVAADEEFGGWASSTGTSKPARGGGFGSGNNEDLFSNVWQ